MENGSTSSGSTKSLKKIQDEIAKSMSGLPTVEEKFSVLLKRCAESEKINKTLAVSQKQNQKLFESLQVEYNHVLTTKSKLESLCRELQKQNKAIKEESLTRIKEEESKRKETQEKFQKSLNEIQKMMNENTEKNDKLKQDNLEMSNKFKYILDQYQQREEQMDKINKQMELVTQLNDAKLEKSKVEALAVKEKSLKETAILEDTIKILKLQLADSVAAEKCLKEQVELYSGKYGEFQESLKKSQNVFEGYKHDMTKMSKKTLKAEKESLVWKSKFEKCNALLLDLISEKQVKDEHITKTARQMYFLQKLCRQLQAERTAFFNALKENSIEIPVVQELPKEADVAPPEEPEPQKEIKSNKLDVMTKSCDQLKKNLAQLQGQLESMSTTDVVKPAKKEKGKKKGKKDKNHEPEEKLEKPENHEEKLENPEEIADEKSKEPKIVIGDRIVETPPEKSLENGNSLENADKKEETPVIEEKIPETEPLIVNDLPKVPAENPQILEAAS